MSRIYGVRERLRGAMLVVATLPVAGLLALAWSGVLADVVKKAAGINEKSPEGLAKFVSAADKLIDPVLIALAAVCPLVILYGAGRLLTGNPKGLLVIGASAGALVLAASAQGIVA